MNSYEYRVVPFVGHLKSGVFTIENAQKVSEQLQAVINQITPGCLASLFGARVSFITFDQVVFRRLLP